MTDINPIKRVLLRALLAAKEPQVEVVLDLAVSGGLGDRPLQSDIDLARRELQNAKFIIGTKDELDGSVIWALTAKGELKAKQLG
jgi:hypothetical protein